MKVREKTAVEVLTGEAPKRMLDGVVYKMVLETTTPIEIIRKKVRIRLRQQAAKRRAQQNKKTNLAVSSKSKSLITPKFRHLYKGPYIVEGNPFPNVYEILNPQTEKSRFATYDQHALKKQILTLDRVPN